MQRVFTISVSQDDDGQYHADIESVGTPPPAAAVQGLMHQLAEIRAAELEPPPTECDCLERKVSINPVRLVAQHDEMQGVYVALRHVGFGWLPFYFAPEEARSLAEALNKHAAQVQDWNLNTTLPN